MNDDLGPSLDDFRADYDIGADEPQHYIYGLYDPRTGDLRYVGKSDRPLERLQNQMNETANTHRCHWLQELKRIGLKPIQTIIDAVPAGTDWQTVERAYIRGARAMSTCVTNGTDGGDGVSGLSEESLARMRATWRGRKHTPEALAKIAAASRGRTHTPEYRAYMRALMRDRQFSPEHRAKIRQAIQKLSPDQVRQIRQLLHDGVKQRDVAAMFDIHQGSVSNIARGVTYKEVL